MPDDADPSLVVAPVPERAAVSAQVAAAEARAYLEAGRPFHAHEVFEQRWRCCPAGERDLWRGLAQWAAALTHAARGNDRGARAVAQRAGATLREWSSTASSAGPAPAGVTIDLDEAIASCERIMNERSSPPEGPGGVTGCTD